MQVPFNKIDNIELYSLWLSVIYPKPFFQAQLLAAKKLNISPYSIEAYCFAAGYIEGRYTHL